MPKEPYSVTINSDNPAIIAAISYMAEVLLNLDADVYHSSRSLTFFMDNLRMAIRRVRDVDYTDHPSEWVSIYTYCRDICHRIHDVLPAEVDKIFPPGTPFH